MLKLLQAQQDELQTKATELKFPNFAGKSKQEFKRWYDTVLAILGSPSWQSVFKDMNKKLLHTDDEIPSSQVIIDWERRSSYDVQAHHMGTWTSFS